jgi:hypothetical protein
MNEISFNQFELKRSFIEPTAIAWNYLKQKKIKKAIKEIKKRVAHLFGVFLLTWDGF